MNPDSNTPSDAKPEGTEAPTGTPSSSIPLTVVGADRAPSAQDEALFERAQALLKADPNFEALQDPTLNRAEVNAGLPDTEGGYLYLRYLVPGQTPQEFWAHWGKKDHLSWKSGQLSVAEGTGMRTT